MKKIFFWLFIVFLVVYASGIIFSRMIILSVSRAQIGKVFRGAKVSLAGCAIGIGRPLTLTGITIKKPGAYDFRIGELRIFYGLDLLSRFAVPKVSLRQAEFVVATPRKKLADFPKELNLASSGKALAIGEIELENVVLKLSTQDLELTSGLSLRLSLPEMRLRSLDIRIDSLDAQGLHAEGFLLQAAQGDKQGIFSLKQARYNKFKTGEARARVELENQSLAFKDLSVAALDGFLTGELFCKIDKTVAYQLDLNVGGLALAAVTRDFELAEKLQMSGDIRGDLHLRGEGLNFQLLRGDLSVPPPGGNLTIKDKVLLERIAGSTNQPLEMIVENFRDYHYNIGIIQLGLEGGDLVLKADLDGPAGKRNLNIVLHDFQLKREGK
jgi:hypothetical protein